MIKSILKSLLLTAYALLVLSHCFFSHSTLNVNLSSKILLAHFYSFPVFWGMIIGGASVLFFVVNFIKYRKKHLGEKRFAFPLFLLGLSIVFVFCSFNTNRVANVDDKRVSLKILELNAQNVLNREGVNRIFKDLDVDIAVFPELGGYSKGEGSEKRLFDLMKEVGLSGENYNVYSLPETYGNIAPVTVVIRKQLSYEQIDNGIMTHFGTVYLHSHTNLPDIIGLHTAPPLPGLMDIWERDLNLIGREIIPQNKNAIVLGDFNATARHGALNLIDSHEDAVDYLPGFRRGTWGLFLPKPFRTTIDHVFIPKNKYSVKNIDLIEFNGPDHVGVFLELAVQ